MKIILSRKGFDAQYGGQASPILPDGTLLSLPIPLSEEHPKYTDLQYNGKTYLEIIQDLKPHTRINQESTCHLDPDIRKNVFHNRPDDWKAIFGQCDAAQGHLSNNKISPNDLFLFFGWFRQTEFQGRKLKYIKGSPDLHIIYGYLQIEHIVRYEENIPEYCRQHVHGNEKYYGKATNCMYIAKERLSFNEELPGSGCLKYKPDLVLTKAGMSRSKWLLPTFFKNLTITYHNENSFKAEYFQSAAKGQEFIISNPSNEGFEWVKSLLQNE